MGANAVIYEDEGAGYGRNDKLDHAHRVHWSRSCKKSPLNMRRDSGAQLWPLSLNASHSCALPSERTRFQLIWTASVG